VSGVHLSLKRVELRMMPNRMLKDVHAGVRLDEEGPVLQHYLSVVKQHLQETFCSSVDVFWRHESKTCVVLQHKSASMLT
jgi:hypothetical protein